MLKKLPKILTYFFILVFLFQLVGLLFLLFQPAATHAAVNFKPQIEIPGGNYDFSKYASGNTTQPIAEYIKIIYKYLIGIVGILATVVMMYGGIIWLTAGGSSDKISDAQGWIKASITGLLLALFSYLILATVNPALVTLKTDAIQNVTPPPGSGQSADPQGCCVYTNSGSTKHAINKKQSECFKISGYVEFKEGLVAYNDSCAQQTETTQVGCCEYSNTVSPTGKSATMTNKVDCNAKAGSFYLNKKVYENKYASGSVIDTSCKTQAEIDTIKTSQSATGCCGTYTKNSNPVNYISCRNNITQSNCLGGSYMASDIPYFVSNGTCQGLQCK